MTTSQQIELPEQVSASTDQYKELLGLFKTIVSESPISGTRETEIVNEYKSLVDDLESLYMEVIYAIADWLQDQP